MSDDVRWCDVRMRGYINDERMVNEGLHYTLFNCACVNNVFEWIGSWNG